MTEPATVNIGLVIPNTGDLPGTWGSAAINPDMGAIDGFIGGVTTIAVSNAPITLTSPVGFTPTPSAGPTQAQNAILKLTGTLTAAVTITLPLPGYYIIDTTGLGLTSVAPVVLRAVGTGQVIGLPFATVRHVYNDGTNVRHCNLQEAGTYLDYAGSAVPTWITSCTVPPFLNCDGSTFSAATYPLLAVILGGTTLPDARGRSRYALNLGTGRLTSGGSGIDGNTRLAAGGTDGIVLTSPTQLPAHTHNNALVDNGHLHSTTPGSFQNTPVGGGSNAQPFISTGAAQNTGVSTTGIALTNASVGAGANIPNAPPGYVGGITMIRAG